MPGAGGDLDRQRPVLLARRLARYPLGVSAELRPLGLAFRLVFPAENVHNPVRVGRGPESDLPEPEPVEYLGSEIAESVVEIIQSPLGRFIGAKLVEHFSWLLALVSTVVPLTRY